MLTYSLADTGSMPLYEYLYECIKKDIVSGQLPGGSRLPSKRSFARNLGISVITVENTYAQLTAEGYIYSLPKKGFYVQRLAEYMPVLQSTGREPGLGREDSAETAWFADLVSNQTNPDNFPFSIWAKLMRETITEQYSDLMKPSPYGGIYELRRAICEYLREFRGMEVTPEQIIVGAGTEYLYSLIIQLLGFDKIYAVENPGYRKIMQIYQSNRVQCCCVDMDGEGVRIDSLEKRKADVVHLSPAHHFPTGIVTTIGRRYELLNWAAGEPQRCIIEDDFDSEFRMEGRPIPMLQSIDAQERVIYINTFSKTLSSTIRVSYMVLPRHLARQFRERLSFYSCTVSTFDQYTLAKFISEGHFEKHINRMRKHYRTLRDALMKEIRKSPFASRVSISEENAGLHFLLRVQTEYSDLELIRRAKERGIRVRCLSSYDLKGEETGKQENSHILIMNYSGLLLSTLPELIQRLDQIL